MDGQRFDRFTKTIAADVTRRGLAKGIGGGLLAAALAGIGRGTVSASNSACAHFCNAVFPPGPARGKCKSDAAKHVPGNLCEACGADPDRICTAENGAQTCCTGDEVCDPETGTCAPPVPCGGSCPPEFPNCCPDGRCGLPVHRICDLEAAEDRCCLTHCQDISDIRPDFGAVCCNPVGSGIPCGPSPLSGFCQPDSDCPACCSGRCGPLQPPNEEGFEVAYCVDASDGAGAS